MEREEFSAGLSHTGKEGKHVEYESDKSPQLQLSADHYFFQTPDGKLIQVGAKFILLLFIIIHYLLFIFTIYYFLQGGRHRKGTKRKSNIKLCHALLDLCKLS